MAHSKFDTIIVGSGLSGMSCAIELAEAGQRVLVLESRPVVGGRTSSWQGGGMPVESGMHRFLGFYELLPDLLNKAGVELDEIVHWEDEIEIRLPDGQPSAVFGLSVFHKPIESLMGGIGNNDFVSPLEKAKLAAFFAHGFADFQHDPQHLGAFTVESYAQKHGLSDETITRVLIPLTEGLFFLPINQYSAVNFFGLFNPYLTKLHQSRVGAFRGGMTEVLMQPLVNYFEQHGGQLRTRAEVDSLQYEDGVTGVICNGEIIQAHSVVIATSLAAAQTLLRQHFKTHP